MSEKIVKFILGKLRIFSLLFILTSLIIEVNGRPGTYSPLNELLRSSQSNQPRDSIQSGQLNQPTCNIPKEIQDRIKNEFEKGIKVFIHNLTKRNFDWTIKYCNEEQGQMTYFVKLPIDNKKFSKTFETIVYVDNNTITDSRFVHQVMSEKKRLEEMQFSNITNAANFSEATLNYIQSLLDFFEMDETTKIDAVHVRKYRHIGKTRLIEYDEIRNKIVYYVDLVTWDGEKVDHNDFAIFTSYQHGHLEYIDIKPYDSSFEKNH